MVCEIGAGTAYYLSTALPPSGRGIALDSSRYASRRAAAADPRVAAVLADAWAPLPVASGVADAALVVFAPRVAAEIARIVRGSGGAVVVTPNPGHLGEVREPLGMLAVDDGKDEAVRDRFEGLLRVGAVDRVRAGCRWTATICGIWWGWGRRPGTALPSRLLRRQPHSANRCPSTST